MKMGGERQAEVQDNPKTVASNSNEPSPIFKDAYSPGNPGGQQLETTNTLSGTLPVVTLLESAGVDTTPTQNGEFGEVFNTWMDATRAAAKQTPPNSMERALTFATGLTAAAVDEGIDLLIDHRPAGWPKNK